MFQLAKELFFLDPSKKKSKFYLGHLLKRHLYREIFAKTTYV